MAKYLLEIGTEELPYKFIPSAQKQLEQEFEKVLKENRIGFDSIKVYGTPRRLALLIDGLANSQPDVLKEIKGPPANIAFDEKGNLTKAAEGFAKKQNIPLEVLYKEKIGDVEYLYAKLDEKGKNTYEILAEIAPKIILSLQGSHYMRWANFETKFSRPIRWIVSLLDNKIVEFNIENVIASNKTRGHRFYSDNEIEITSIDKYFDDLYNAKVIVDPDKRSKEIIQRAKEIAKTVGGTAHLDEELVKEVTYILEWPVAVLGNFEEKYLSIPDDVTVTVMASHQRYFPVYDSQGKLMNHFITMANYIGDELSNIKNGNERVIKARLDDAIFFYKEDTKRTLESRVEELKGVTFQKGLGSVYDKIDRVQKLGANIADSLNLTQEQKSDIQRATLICKTDLVTYLVREFTELEGVIGADYAMKNGEKHSVALAIKEHYMPVGSSGELAQTIVGQVVGIADKIDTICSVFASGRIPTGSADPLGLRRAALGCVLTVKETGIKVNLSELIKKAITLIPIQIEDTVKLENAVREFITQRLKVYLNEKYKYDLVDAAISANDALSNINDLVQRIEILKELVNSKDYSNFHESAIRIQRLIKNEECKSEPDTKLFVQEVEGQLWDCVKNIEDNKLSYNELVQKLQDIIPIIEEFFEKVLVMDKDEQVKANRISLLGKLRNKFMKIADFSKIVI